MGPQVAALMYRKQSQRQQNKLHSSTAQSIQSDMTDREISENNSGLSQKLKFYAKIAFGIENVLVKFYF